MLKVFEAFAGVGSQRMALRNLGIEHKVVGIAEIDKFALQSYEAIHGDCPNFGDISKINPKDLPDMDLFTYSFPCQDLSVAGKQAGLTSGTRSGLLYECEKVIEAKRPKYLLLENVKNLVGKKFKNDFDKWLDYLETLGYKNYWKVLNAKNYGVPQNRERVFVVSILGEEDYSFPEEQELKKAIKDILEKEVPGKFYLNKPFKMVNKKNVVAELDMKGREAIKRVYDQNGQAPTLTTMGGGHREPKILVVGSNQPEHSTSIGQRYMIYSENGLMGTLTATDYKQPKQILVYKNYEIELPCIARQVGRNLENPTSRKAGLSTEQMLEPCVSGTSNTLTTVTKDNYAIEEDYRVRKLTPLECWRLMGFKDEDFYKAEKVCSNTQLYKQAGNSIVVPVLEGIFRNLLIK